ncbi:MAG: hypothetical protein K2P76_11005 [Lachnospiraceae bacterium]|nr:hypothetical protein [Lachnospiraceae bacterium]MDE6981663.1 hypothetical protein [Lachnospiraceae bacterium]
MDKRIKIGAGVLLAVFALGLAVFAYKGGSGKGVEIFALKVSGTEGEENIFRFALDTGTMTYVQEAEISGQTFTLDSGSFSVDEKGFQLYSETDDVNSLHFVKNGEYIFPEQYLCEGEIPSGSVFEAVCSYEAQGVKGEVSFHEDGTYEESTADGEVRKGTYEREGDLIHRTQEDGSADLDFYVYGNQITNSFYKKVK